jgi:hypothetical protein
VLTVVTAHQMDCPRVWNSKRPQATTDCDQRPFWPEDETEGERGEPCERDAGHGDRLGAADLETIGGSVSTTAREVDDGERSEDTGNAEHREWPPGRGGVEAEATREVGEDRHLGLKDQFEEPPGEQRHDDADDRDEDEQHRERAAVKYRGGSTGGSATVSGSDASATRPNSRAAKSYSWLIWSMQTVTARMRPGSTSGEISMP